MMTSVLRAMHVRNATSWRHMVVDIRRTAHDAHDIGAHLPKPDFDGDTKGSGRECEVYKTEKLRGYMRRDSLMIRRV